MYTDGYLPRLPSWRASPMPRLNAVMSVRPMNQFSLDKIFFLLPKVFCFLSKAFAYDQGMRLGGTSSAKPAAIPLLQLRPSPTWKGSYAPHFVVTCLRRSRLQLAGPAQLHAAQAPPP